MIVSCTFGSRIPDEALWTCAHEQLRLLGSQVALVEATERIDELEATNDIDGARTWMAIALRIVALSMPRQERAVRR